MGQVLDDASGIFSGCDIKKSRERMRMYLAIDGRWDVLVRKDRACEATEQAYDTRRWLGEAKTGTRRNNARQLRDALLRTGTRRERQCQCTALDRTRRE